MGRNSIKDFKIDDILTTGQLAKFCSVDPRTVHRWMNEGLLASHVLPVTKFRRVQVKDFVRFLQTQKMPVPEQLRRVSKWRILIVDDESAMLNAIRRILNDFPPEDFLFETATDGFTAGSALQKFSPDLIILDLKMPRMNGFEVCRLIKEDPEMKHVKILAVSGTMDSGTNHGDRQKILNLGADNFLAKPFTEQELKSSVLQLLFQEGKTND